jgi:Ala-tRNA(Pro) deacylase
VCPFSVINDTVHAVKIVLDKKMMAAPLVCYHPLENHLTVGIAPGGLLKFLDFTGHTPHIVDVTGKES